jgi:hypothetical protein
MAEFNYSDYVAKMAQRKGPMHEMDNDKNDANQITNSYLNQVELSSEINESETIYEFGSDGNCYRIDDEGNRDVVSDSYCQRYGGQGVREDDTMDDNEDSSVEESLDDEDGVDNSGIENDIEQDLMYAEDPIFYLKSIIDFCNKKIQKIQSEEDGLEEVIDDTDVEVTDDEFGSSDSDKEPTKKDIKAAEKEFNLSIPQAGDVGTADSALEKAKQIIKIKVGKLLAQPKGQRSTSPDLIVLRQFIQKPEIKKAFKARGLDVMDFVKDVIA